MAHTLRELALSILLAIALFAGIDSVTARSYVEGQSMEPTLHKDQVLLISRLGVSGVTGQVYAAVHQDDRSSTGGWVPPRGSICTFIHPTDPTRVLVKRVIGLPGEQIFIIKGTVYINGQELREPYVVFHDTRDLTPRRIPEDSIFVMGDNRPASNDSRAFGAVPRSHLVGVAVLRYWPLTEFRLLLGGS